jgi:hypothetical protein
MHHHSPDSALEIYDSRLLATIKNQVLLQQEARSGDGVIQTTC